MLRQIALKSQDLLVVLKIACHRNRSFTYVQLAEELGIAASQAHSCLKRARASGLVVPVNSGGVEVVGQALREFIVYGVKYAFPAAVGGPARGMATSYAAPPLRDMIVQTDELPPVWPTPDGATRGLAFTPLYPTVPNAAAKDRQLYECLALIDALRSGAARERDKAQHLLMERL
jgi:hypothetical protein